nr:YdhK family protein [Lysinibacillus timonensis]
MGNKSLLAFTFSLVMAFTLTACGNNNAQDSGGNAELSAKNGTNETNETNNTNGTNDTNSIIESNETNENIENSTGNMNTDVESSNSALLPREIPEGIKEAENPKYNIGDLVTINAEHEVGMQGAQGAILGAYDTIVYSVSYNPTDGSQPEENHKWIVQEELQRMGDEKILAPGTEVILEADYEPGMFGAEGEIDTAEKTTVYMVEYMLKTGVQKQKWLKESELSKISSN